MTGSVDKLEKALAEFTGAPYVVTTDCCTHAIELCFRLLEIKSCSFTAYTYLSVPMTMHLLGVDYQLTDTSFGTSSTGESGFKLPKPNLTRLSEATQNKPVSNFANFKTSPSSSIKVGQKVEHARFGKGKVLSIEGTSGNEKATIEFNDFGQKLILMKFAKLRIIE